MKKKHIFRFLCIVCIFLIVGFCVRLGADLYHYNETFSAPFSVFILIRSIEFLLPALILFLIAIYIKKRNSLNSKKGGSENGCDQNDRPDKKI